MKEKSALDGYKYYYENLPAWYDIMASIKANKRKARQKRGSAKK